MGLYRRPSGVYWMCYTTGGKQRHESAKTHNKKLAQKAWAIRTAEIAEGKWNLPASKPPLFKAWAEQYRESIRNPNTKARYGWSIDRFLEFWGENARLSDVASVRRIEEFKQKRLASGLMNASVNRDLSLLRRLLTLAARQRLISRNPFTEIEFLEEKKYRRQPHILTLEEQSKLIAVVSPKLRALIYLITETGLRVNKEALQMRWTDVDFRSPQITIRDSKTVAGRRVIPLSELCKNELCRWYQLTGPSFSPFLFPNPKKPSIPIGCVRTSWSKALRDAKLAKFPPYCLRHTFASRLAAAGASPITVAQLLGHSSTSVVMTYARSVEEARRDAIRKLEEFRELHETRSSNGRDAQIIQ